MSRLKSHARQEWVSSLTAHQSSPFQREDNGTQQTVNLHGIMDSIRRHGHMGSDGHAHGCTHSHTWAEVHRTKVESQRPERPGARGQRQSCPDTQTSTLSFCHLHSEPQTHRQTGQCKYQLSPYPFSSTHTHSHSYQEVSSSAEHTILTPWSDPGTGMRGQTSVHFLSGDNLPIWSPPPLTL